MGDGLDLSIFGEGAFRYRTSPTRYALVAIQAFLWVLALVLIRTCRPVRPSADGWRGGGWRPDPPCLSSTWRPILRPTRGTGRVLEPSERAP